MLKHIASVLGILYFVIGFQSIAYPFFTPHEISLVKETKVIEDPTLTYENLFSTYEFCQNGTWYLRGCPACFLILKGMVISSHETNRFS